MSIMKIKNLIYISSIFFLAVSCDEDFLETYPTASLSQEQVGEALAVNPAAAEGTLFGIYEQFYRLGSGGYGGQEDFGIKIQHLHTDLLSGDMAHTGKSYNRQTSISELTGTVDAGNAYANYMPWRFLYRVVNLSNLVIDGLGGADATGPLGTLETDIQKHTMGQALAARGFAYYYLANLFVDDISDTSQLVLPIYHTAEQVEQPKSSLADVWAITVSDLKNAETLLDGFSRGSKVNFNQDIVRGLLAYTYGAMNDWANAETYAKLVVDAGYPIMTNDEVAYSGGAAQGGFNSVNNHPGIMWGVDITPSQELASLFTWWGFVDVYGYSYAAVGNRKAIDLDLYLQIRPDDARLNQFLFAAYGASWLVPNGKFYYNGIDPSLIGNPAGLFSGPQVNVDSDAHYMRVAEFYLLHAEAAFENGNEATAKASLKALADIRIADTSYIDALTGADLEAEIDFQTRLELFGEGKSYFLMKRQRKSITRGGNWLDFAGETFQHNDDRLTYEIPEEEILYNPNISDQN